MGIGVPGVELIVEPSGLGPAPFPVICQLFRGELAHRIGRHIRRQVLHHHRCRGVSGFPCQKLTDRRHQSAAGTVSGEEDMLGVHIQLPGVVKGIAHYGSRLLHRRGEGGFGRQAVIHVPDQRAGAVRQMAAVDAVPVEPALHIAAAVEVDNHGAVVDQSPLGADAVDRYSETDSFQMEECFLRRQGSQFSLRGRREGIAGTHLLCFQNHLVPGHGNTFFQLTG